MSTGGRLVWASLSDQIGRRKTFMIFTLASIPLYLSIPTFISMVVENGETLPIYGFIGSSVLCISMMGGTYAILPAYEADLYGAKVGPDGVYEGTTNCLQYGIQLCCCCCCFFISVVPIST